MVNQLTNKSWLWSHSQIVLQIYHEKTQSTLKSLCVEKKDIMNAF